ncbi:MAG: TldD/PmbA family protein [Nitrospiria bacterium]
MKPVDEIGEFLTDSLAKLRNSGIDQGEVLYWETESGTMRTFLNRMGPSVTSRDAEVYVNATAGKKQGQAYSTDLTDDGIHRMIRQCRENIRHATDSRSFFPLPGAYTTPPFLRKQIFFESTLNLSSEEKVDALQKITEESKKGRLDCSARLTSGGARMGVVNTSGTFLITEYTEASLSLILTGDTGISAYASDASECFDSLDTVKVAREAIQNANRQSFQPVVDLNLSGKDAIFDVILEPYAVAEWVELMASVGFNGLLYEEGESFLSNKLNQKVVGDNITFYDDGSDPGGFIAPFDFEGVPKEKKVLFERGVARSVCYDSFLAGKYGKKSTGHALSPFEKSYGAVPRNLFLEGGHSSLTEMIASSFDPTIYITRFHYTNVVNPKEGILTGMTKDGTFLVQNGKMVGPVSNLRFLESVPKALCRVTHLGQSRRVHDPVGYGGLFPESTVVPPLKIERVRFIGSSGNLAR